MKTKFYHCSPKRFKKGDVLICPVTDDKRNYDFGIDGVWIHTKPIPHFTIWDKISERKKKWFMYEVEPVGKLYRGEWDDIICESANVIRKVGDAYGILLNWKKQVIKHKDIERAKTFIEKFAKPDENGELPPIEEYIHICHSSSFVHTKEWKNLKKRW